MNWINYTGKLKLLIVGGVLLAAISALIITSISAPISPDTFWHLRMGQDWLANGLSPYIDRYSFTYNGNEIAGPPVIFQGLLYLSVSQFGLLTGLQVLRLGFFVLIVAAAFLSLRQMKAPVIIYAIVIPLLVFLLQVRALVRPEMLGYVFMIVALVLYFRARTNITPGNVLPMIALMLVWVNYHSAILGYIIFFGFFLDCAVAQIDSRVSKAVWIKWFAWGLVIVAIGFLNPEFSHPLIGTSTFSAEWKILINEYLPPAPFLKSLPGIYVVVLFAAMTPVLAYQQRRFGMLVVWAVFTYSAVTMQRMVLPSGIVIVLITTHLFINGNVFQRLRLANSGLWNKIAGFGLLILVGATLYSNVERARFFVDEDRTILGQYPVALADYLIEQGKTGRIFNQYGLGGFLIYRLTPDYQVYIDGRTGILYPLAHMKKYLTIISAKNPEVLRSELDKYSIDTLIWPYSADKHDLVQDIGGFGLDFMSTNHVLYTRGASNFPLHGELLSRPQCWHPEMVEELNVERTKMSRILPEQLDLLRFADLVVGYSNATDGKAYIDASIEGDEWLDEMRRFAGFRFLQTGQYDLVPMLLGGVKARNPKDYLGSAWAKIKSGDYETAAQIIDDYSGNRSTRLQPEDIFIHYKLYRLLELQRHLTDIEQRNSDDLLVRLTELGLQDRVSTQELKFEHFCKVSENWFKGY